MFRTLAIAAAISLFVSAANAETILEFTGPFGGISAPGQSVTTGSGNGWNDLEFNWFKPTGGATSAGTLYLLDQEYLGAPSGLSGATAGFIASSIGVSSNRYVFDPIVAIGPNQQYWFYTDTILPNGGGMGFAGGDSYFNNPTNDIDANFSKSLFDAAFRLSGEPIPEPSTLALLGLAALGLIARSRYLPGDFRSS